jgi:hypothetical protein
MAAKKRAGGPNRSAFIRDQLNANPGAKLGDVQEAWSSAGNSGEITGTLYYQVKKSMGLSNRRKKKKGRAAAAPTGSPSISVETSNSAEGYLAIEKSLDKLIAQAGELGDTKLTEELRVARRRASARLV